MIRAWHHIAVLVCLVASPALAQTDDAYAEFDAWIDDRVRIFSDVCMGSAPLFDRFHELAEAAGLTLDTDADRWTLKPDVSVNLREHNDRCSCVMVMATLEYERQMASLILKLHEGEPETVRDPNGPGEFSKFFKRDGVLVRVVLETANFSGHDFIKGYAIGEEPCPT